MPWHIVENSAQCPSDKPHAVVKDDDGSVVGCHANADDAQNQLAALYASEERMTKDTSKGDKYIGALDTLRAAFQALQNAILGAPATIRTIVDVDSWDGSASNYSDTDAYCKACLIDVNSAAGRDEKAQSHCMLPVRREGDPTDTYVKQAVTAAAGGHGISQVSKPDDVPQDAWDSARTSAANKIISAYGQWDAVAPDGVYEIAGREPPTEARAMGLGRLYEQIDMAIYQGNPGGYPWLHDIYVDDGPTLFAIVSMEGKLYRAEVGLAGESISVGELEQVTETFTPVQTRTTIHRQDDGRWRWHSISATSVLNRVGEIDSRALFNSFVEDIERTGEYPTRDFFHLGNSFRVGQADFVQRVGNVLATSGLYDEGNPLADAEIKARQKEPDYWGESIEYVPAGKPEMVEISGQQIPVFTEGKLRFISTLPENAAASWFTNTYVKREATQQMKDKIKEAIIRLFDGDENEADKFIAMVDQVNRSIETDDLIRRQGQAGADAPQPQIAGQAPQPQIAGQAPQPVIELDDGLVDAVVERLAGHERISGALDTLTQRMGAIETSLETLTGLTGSIDQVNARLAALEQTDQERQRQFLADMPATQGIVATYRPKVARGNEANGEGGGNGTLATSSDVAKQNLEAKKLPAW